MTIKTFRDFEILMEFAMQEVSQWKESLKCNNIAVKKFFKLGYSLGKPIPTSANSLTPYYSEVSFIIRFFKLFIPLKSNSVDNSRKSNNLTQSKKKMPLSKTQSRYFSDAAYEKISVARKDHPT